MDPVSLKQRAAADFGLAAFGKDPFAENFTRLVGALNFDGAISAEGVALSEAEIQRLLLIHPRLRLASRRPMIS